MTHICPYCELVMSNRTQHCAICEKCIERYDHHCPWVNNCIGVKNHNYFLWLIITLFGYLFIGINISVVSIISLIKYPDEIDENELDIHFVIKLVFISVTLVCQLLPFLLVVYILLFEKNI